MNFQQIDFREKKMNTFRPYMSIFIKNQVNLVVFKYTFRFYTIENTIFIMKNRYHGVSIYRKNKYIHAIYVDIYQKLSLLSRVSNTFRFHSIENTIFTMKTRYHGVSIYRFS